MSTDTNYPERIHSDLQIAVTEIRWLMIAEWLCMATFDQQELVKNWERLTGHRFSDLTSNPKRRDKVFSAWMDFVRDVVWDRLDLKTQDELIAKFGSPIERQMTGISTSDSANCSPNENNAKANNQTDLVNNTEDK